MPRVSVITTLYNRETYVPEAIASVLAQTEPDWEMIIWDDASTDHSLRIARQAAGVDPRIRLIEAGHQGHALALRDAFAEARAPYLAQLDSDDRLTPDALQKTCDHLDAHPEVGLVYSKYRALSPTGKLGPVGKRCDIPYSPDRLLIDMMVFHLKVIRRDAYDQAGGVTDEFPFAEDYDLILRLSELTGIEQIPDVLYEYRVHEESMSLTRSREQIESSKGAVESALERRGLADDYELDVRISSMFELTKRAEETEAPSKEAFRQALRDAARKPQRKRFKRR